jgi:hypothetical protein
MRRFFSGPVVVGLVFGAIGLALTGVGVVRGEVPLQPASILIALLIGGGVWFLVAWAVATAARDVESDLASEPEPALEAATVSVADET